MVYDFGDKAHESEYVEGAAECVLDFARFMQERQSRRFVRKNGFPKRLFFVNEYKNYKDFKSEREFEVGLRMAELERMRRLGIEGVKYSLSNVEGNWPESASSEVVKLNSGYNKALLMYLMEVIPREEMVADDGIFYKKDFDSLLDGFPIFGRGGICKHLVDLGSLEFRSPTDSEKASFGMAYSELEKGNYSLSLA